MPEPIQYIYPEIKKCNWGNKHDKGFCLCQTCTLFYCSPCNQKQWMRETSTDCEMTQCNKYSNFYGK